MSGIRNLPLKRQMLLFLASGILILSMVQLFYYFKFYGTVQNSARNYAANIVSQVGEKLSSSAEVIENAARTVGYSNIAQEIVLTGDPEELIQLDDAAMTMLGYIVESNPMISDIAIINGGVRTTSLRRSVTPLVLANIQDEYDLDSLNEPVFTAPMQMTIHANAENAFLYILPVYEAHGLTGLNRKIAYVIVVCKLESVSGILQGTDISENSLLSILDGEGRTIATSQPAPASEGAGGAGRTGSKPEGRTIVQSELIEPMQWSVVSEIPVNDITSELRDISRSGMIMTLVLIGLQLLIGLLLMRSILQPILQMIRSMRRIGGTDLKARIEVQVVNEVGAIAGHINRMLDKIENLTSNNLNIQSRLYETELTRREAELAALQSQINPHFLYNTLDCIRSIGLVRGVPEVVDISTSMALIYRYSIKGNFFTTVRKEVECIEHYLRILDIRFGGRFSASFDIDEEAMACQVILMSLQPIVENAIYHGLEPKAGPGRLTIEGRIRNDLLRLTVSDDGVGMSKAELARIRRVLAGEASASEEGRESGRSIGLANINSRIRLYHGEGSGLEVFSTEGEGTRVVLTIRYTSGKEARASDRPNDPNLSRPNPPRRPGLPSPPSAPAD